MGAAEGGIVVPSALFQPIAAEDVADRLAEVAMSPPLNGTIDIAGPEKAPFDEFIARRLKASGDPDRWWETQRRRTTALPSTTHR